MYFASSAPRYKYFLVCIVFFLDTRSEDVQVWPMLVYLILPLSDEENRGKTHYEKKDHLQQSNLKSSSKTTVKYCTKIFSAQNVKV